MLDSLPVDRLKIDLFYFFNKGWRALLALFLSLSFSLSAWAVCSFSGTKNQEGSLKHDGTNLYRCDSGNSWENLGTLTGADNLGNHTATQNLILGSYYLSGDGGNEGVYVDATGNVGIGTAGPAYSLDIQNSSTFSELRIKTTVTGSTNASTLILDRGDQTDGYAGISYKTAGSNTWTINVPAGTDDLRFYDYGGTAGERLRLQSSTGYVGIGTTNPSSRLDVRGGGGLTINQATAPLEIKTNPGGQDYATFASPGYAGTIMLMNLSNGYVGIGTTSPTAKLDVVGEIKFGNSSSSCTAGTEGQQRYNSTSKQMEFCNGSTWKSLRQHTTKCSYSWTAPAAGWQTHTWVTGDCSNGLPSASLTYDYVNNTHTVTSGGFNLSDATCSTTTGAAYSSGDGTTYTVTCLFVERN